ncbi:MAG: hypothetical protein ACKOYP_12155 [Bacteroidota bacterium]
MMITSKKLASGNYQVKFKTGDFYGYLLVEPGTAVRDVVTKISSHLRAMENKERYFQRTLYSVGAYAPQSHRILLFSNS